VSCKRDGAASRERRVSTSIAKFLYNAELGIGAQPRVVSSFLPPATTARDSNKCVDLDRCGIQLRRDPPDDLQKMRDGPAYLEREEPMYATRDMQLSTLRLWISLLMFQSFPIDDSR